VGRVIQTGLFVVNDIKGNELNREHDTPKELKVCNINTVGARNTDSGQQIEE